MTESESDGVGASERCEIDQEGRRREEDRRERRGGKTGDMEKRQ